MNRFDKEIRESISRKDVPIPENFHARVEQTLSGLPVKEKKIRASWVLRVAAVAASLVFVLLVLLPNVSPAYAQALETVPVIGRLVEVFNFRNDTYSSDRRELNAEIPHVQDEENPQAGELINKSVDELTNDVIQRFYDELEASSGEGYGSIYIDYETVTNSESWFTLKLSVSEISASSDRQLKYYHINRASGSYVTFGDLISSDSFPVIEEEIRRQMTEQMEKDEETAYWTDAERAVPLLTEDQNFYFTPEGSLVIVYNKYEVAPGSMGNPEFLIPRETYAPCLRDR